MFNIIMRVTVGVSVWRSCVRSFVCETLRGRSVVELRGDRELLQGLLSNNIYNMETVDCLYSLLLSAHGRVLFDTLVYKKQPERIYLECDEAVCERLVKHIMMYKMKKKVDIVKVKHAEISVILPENDSEKIESLKIHEDNEDLVYFGSDPRVRSWAIRVLSLVPLSVESMVNVGLRRGAPGCYLESRMRLGVCEGVQDFGLEATALPLEYNGDIMHGVSFNKGCYLGQELTARTHHTGVVRKRLLPVQLEHGDLGGRNLCGRELFCEGGVSAAGVLKSLHEKSGCGLALLSLSKLSFLKRLSDGSTLFKPLLLHCPTDSSKGSPNIVSVTPKAPYWWPKEDIVLPTQ